MRRPGRLRRWLRKLRHSPQQQHLPDASAAYDEAIDKQLSCYAELRQRLLSMLYLQAKLESEAVALRARIARAHQQGRGAGGASTSVGAEQQSLRRAVASSEQLLGRVRATVRNLTDEMARLQTDLASLRRERLEAKVLWEPEDDSPSDQAFLAQAHLEIEQALRG